MSRMRGDSGVDNIGRQTRIPSVRIFCKFSDETDISSNCFAIICGRSYFFSMVPDSELTSRRRAHNRASTRASMPSPDSFSVPCPPFDSGPSPESNPASHIARISSSASAMYCLNLVVEVSGDENLDSMQNLMRWGAIRSKERA